MKQDYKVLPQNERDNISNSSIPEVTTRKCSCCFTTFVVLGIIAILGGITGLTVSLMFPSQFNNVVTGYWPGQQDNQNITDYPVSVGNVTFETSKKTTQKPSEKKNTPLPSVPTLAPVQVDNNSTVAGNGTSSEEDSGEDGSAEVTEESTSGEDVTTVKDEEDAEEEATTSPPPPAEENSVSHEKPQKNGNKKDKDGNSKHANKPKKDAERQKEDELADSVDEYLQNAEKILETATGIRRAEIVVPLFMFLCFLISLLLASCCCYFLMRRRDNRRRRVLGKIITDLHTGDSKSILLDQDMDD